MKERPGRTVRPKGPAEEPSMYAVVYGRRGCPPCSAAVCHLDRLGIDVDFRDVAGLDINQTERLAQLLDGRHLPWVNIIDPRPGANFRAWNLAGYQPAAIDAAAATR